MPGGTQRRRQYGPRKITRSRASGTAETMPDVTDEASTPGSVELGSVPHPPNGKCSGHPRIVHICTNKECITHCYSAPGHRRHLVSSDREWPIGYSPYLTIVANYNQFSSNDSKYPNGGVNDGVRYVRWKQKGQLPPAQPHINTMPNPNRTVVPADVTPEQLLLDEYRTTSCNQRLCRDPAEEKRAVIRFTTSTIWKRVKFINSDEMLNEVSEKSLMGFVTEQLSVGVNGPDQVRKRWWDQHKELIRTSIKTQRSNVTSSLKTAFLGKNHTKSRALVTAH